eukprot:3424045-Amphidinium_carterae.1
MSRKMLQDQGHLPELPLRRWLTEMMESRSDAQGDWRDGHALQIWHSPSRPITRPAAAVPSQQTSSTNQVQPVGKAAQAVAVTQPVVAHQQPPLQDLAPMESQQPPEVPPQGPK